MTTVTINIWLCIWLLSDVVRCGVIRDYEGSQSEDPSCISYTMSNMLHVDCSERGLSELPEDLAYDAQVLDLSNNNFLTFPKGLEKFTNLEVLHLSGNRLHSPLPNYMVAWTSLHTLNLSNNLYSYWASTGVQFSVTTLDLSKNKINNTDFNDFKGLHFLDLSENRLTSLEIDAFTQITNLEYLILSRNYFSEVPHILSASLKSLSMSNCQIGSLYQDSLAGMNSLIILDLSINQIESIPDNFASNSLQELNLSYNEISSITDETFSSLPHLAVLDLRGNEFKEIWWPSYFSSNLYLREIYVKGNRWSCDNFGVNLLLTYEYLTKEPSKVFDKSSLMCYTPGNVTQMNWQEAYIQTRHPNSTSNTEQYTVIAVLVGIIIGVIITSFVCRGLMSMNSPPESPSRVTETTILNLSGATSGTDSVVMRVPLHEDLPPSYDEALLMPRMNSFHSLPDFIDENEEEPRRNRRSRSIGDLTEPRPRVADRRSVRRTVEIRIN